MLTGLKVWTRVRLVKRINQIPEKDYRPLHGEIRETSQTNMSFEPRVGELDKEVDH